MLAEASCVVVEILCDFPQFFMVTDMIVSSHRSLLPLQYSPVHFT